MDTRDSTLSFDVLPGAPSALDAAVVKKDLMVKSHNGSFRSVLLVFDSKLSADGF